MMDMGAIVGGVCACWMRVYVQSVHHRMLFVEFLFCF